MSTVCPSCRGARACTECSGTGTLSGLVCRSCTGSTVCNQCRGTGVTTTVSGERRRIVDGETARPGVSPSQTPSASARRRMKGSERATTVRIKAKKG
ncbi:MAG: hypothetical protein ACHREM_06405 [Polyangiales bacterium]